MPEIPVKPLFYLALALAAAFALWALYHAITVGPKAEAKLARTQAGAAQQSGADAVNAVGAAGEREAAGEGLTRENSAAIHAAPGAQATVSAEVDGAGIAALCRRAAYRKDPRCARR